MNLRFGSFSWSYKTLYNLEGMEMERSLSMQLESGSAHFTELSVALERLKQEQTYASFE
jgi:hypothetical protein